MADLPNVNVEQIEEFKRLANTDGDTSVVMLNLNDTDQKRVIQAVNYTKSI